MVQTDPPAASERRRGKASEPPFPLVIAIVPILGFMAAVVFGVKASEDHAPPIYEKLVLVSLGVIFLGLSGVWLIEFVRSFRAWRTSDATVDSALPIPALRPNECSVVIAETDTGIVLTPDGASWHLKGAAPCFRIFQSESEAAAFAHHHVGQQPKHECWIRNDRGDVLGVTRKPVA